MKHEMVEDPVLSTFEYLAVPLILIFLKMNDQNLILKQEDVFYLAIAILQRDTDSMTLREIEYFTVEMLFLMR